MTDEDPNIITDKHRWRMAITLLILCLLVLTISIIGIIRIIGGK